MGCVPNAMSLRTGQWHDRTSETFIDHVLMMKWFAMTARSVLAEEGTGTGYGHHGSRDVGLAMDPHFALQILDQFKFNLPMLASLSFKYFLRADGLLNYPCSHRTALSVFHHSHKMPAFSFLAVCFITFSVYSFWYIFLGLLSLGVSMDHSRGRRWLTFASLS